MKKFIGTFAITALTLFAVFCIVAGVVTIMDKLMTVYGFYGALAAYIFIFSFIVALIANFFNKKETNE